MSTSAAYRAALLTMSKATAAFADAMERCSGYAPAIYALRSIQSLSCLPRLKGPSYESGSRLQAAAGVHHLIGNLWHVLVRAFHCLSLLLRSQSPDAQRRQKHWIRSLKSPFDNT